MEHNPSRNLALPTSVLLCLAAVGVSAWAFWGWMKFGSSILLSAGETALSWCF
jgi:hypothetical protein